MLIPLVECMGALSTMVAVEVTPRGAVMAATITLMATMASARHSELHL